MPSGWVWNAELEYDDFTLKKNLVFLAVGKTLLDIDSRRYCEVSNLLGEKYGIELADSYEHPECLRKTLRELYGNSSGFIIESIGQNLSGFPDHAEIAKFLGTLSGKL